MVSLLTTMGGESELTLEPVDLEPALAAALPDLDDGLRSRIQAAIGRVTATGAAETLAYDSASSGGGGRSYEVRFTPSSGVPVNVVVRDLTHERDLERQVLAAQRMEAVGQLAGGIAHDFNNVLTVIQSYAELLRGQFEDGDPARGDSELILDAVARAARMTQRLLAFSRRRPQALASLSINDVVTGLEKMLRRLIGEDIDLVIELDPDLGRVRADHSQLEQVIMNLVVNARDAMPTGGRLTIRTAAFSVEVGPAGPGERSPSGRYAALVVADEGIGMDAETRSQIFHPFFSTKQSSGGTGLGLATTHCIVKQHGGFVRVASEPGRGSTFEVCLPLAAASEPGAAAPRDDEPEARPGSSRVILLVEDDELVRRACRRVLERFGHEVLEASTGIDALRIADRHDGPIDIAITDLVMPNMSGFELATRLAVLRPELPVLFVSGYTDEALESRGEIPTSVRILHKPYAASDLLAAIRDTLDPAEDPRGR